jgi:hypothetical protein
VVGIDAGHLIAVVVEEPHLDPGAGFPQDPGLRSWSAGSSTVFAQPADLYTSNSDSGGKSHVHLLQGEAPRGGVGDHAPHRRVSYLAFLIGQ